MKIFVEKFAVLVIVAGLAVLIATRNVVSSAPAVVAGQLAAIALLIWSRRSFPKHAFAAGAAPRATALITTGPYGVLRHPIYAAAALFFWVTAIGHPSPVTAAVALAATLTMLIRIPAEERLLRARFADYDAYARRTKRVVPFVW